MIFITFGRKSLIERHISLLTELGILQISLVIGYQSRLVIEKVSASCDGVSVDFVENLNFDQGSGLSLLLGLSKNKDQSTLIMDADVLYDRNLLTSLVNSPFSTCLLVDEELDDTGEEVKVVANSNGFVTALGKRINHEGTCIVC